MKYLILSTAVLAAGCGGGQSAPTVIATSTPVTPISTPTPSPTLTPAPVDVLQAAPLSSTPTILAKGRRSGQSISAPLPLLVQGAGISPFTPGPIVGIQPGIVLGINTQDGGFAKVYFASATQGLALHANTDGSYAF